MKNLYSAVLLICILLVPSLRAQTSPSNELTEEVAARLISEALEIRNSGIHIATILEGTKRVDDGFEERTVRRVTAVHPFLTDGRLIRRVRCYDFSWSNRYGWFYQESRTTRGGEEVWIWSELKGRVIVR